ncbi:hypothetical protein QSJ18_04940 [Gordonia sp. ABSL1-1]|uniref:hypothetical protein n=1 Tax=Gordonia sp. ABSL1-1 TaxID=3053923 RepID=UPI0025726502|nr:hypothetical protein [Gordonia sp. ABSL1-1]MDL9936078.1 hypothetical protein [Gordonia sp. ABSL1-1]
MSTSTFRPTWLDLARGDSRVVIGMGPCRVPAGPDLAADLFRLARISTGNRLAVRRVPHVRHWRVDPDRLIDAVTDFAVAFPGSDHLSLREKVTLLHNSTPTPDGLRIYTTGDQLITDIPHAVFDGVMIVQLWLYLTRWRPGMTPAWAQAPLLRPHLAWALTRHLALDPRRLAAIARTGRPAGSAAGTPAPIPSTTASPVAQLATRSATLDPAGLAGLRNWRTESAPDTTMAVILMTVLTRALTEAGVQLAPRVHVVVDGRRYDRRLGAHLGNAAVGLNLEFARAAPPQDLQRELGRAVAAGRPLAAMLAISFGQFMSRHRTQEPSAVASAVTESDGAVASFSHLLGLDTMPDGDWLGGFDRHELIGITEPMGQDGIAFLMLKMRDRYDLSASFRPGEHDAGAIEAALDRATRHPVELLAPGLPAVPGPDREPTGDFALPENTGGTQ